MGEGEESQAPSKKFSDTLLLNLYRTLFRASSFAFNENPQS
jgi:hypothetical protein